MFSVFVIGGTGLCGKHLVKELLASNKFSKVTLFTRKLYPEEYSKSELTNLHIFEQKIINFEDLECVKEDFKNFDIGISTLGTTRAVAGSAENFIKIDHGYTLNVAKIFKTNSTKEKKHFLLLTSSNSDENSFFLYPKTKGLLERDIKELGFDSLSIFRPALLLLENGEKRDNERFAESLAMGFSSLIGNPKSFTVPGKLVGRAMCIVASKLTNNSTGVHFYSNVDIHNISNEI
ncbi:hypothetical protein HDU92_002825 [Lobulomyces angularis]|nr:hypothetical protein HDU92_002825 [Lobulomyces angularis]